MAVSMQLLLPKLMTMFSKKVYHTGVLGEQILVRKTPKWENALMSLTSRVVRHMSFSCPESFDLGGSQYFRRTCTVVSKVSFSVPDSH